MYGALNVGNGLISCEERGGKELGGGGEGGTGQLVGVDTIPAQASHLHLRGWDQADLGKDRCYFFVYKIGSSWEKKLEQDLNEKYKKGHKEKQKKHKMLKERKRKPEKEEAGESRSENEK